MKIDSLTNTGVSIANAIVDKLCDQTSAYSNVERLGEEAPLNSGHLPKEFAPLEQNLFPDGRVYAQDGKLCIENLAKIPLHRCVKTNETATKVMRMQLRNPWKPDTWWGRQPRRLTIGLSSSALRRHRVFKTLSVLCFPAAIFACWAGIFVSLWLFALPFPLVVASGILRSISPIWAKEVSREFTSIKGVSSEYLQNIGRP